VTERALLENASHSSPTSGQAADSRLVGAATAPPPNRLAAVTPLAPERYKLQCTLSRQTYEKLRRAQNLLRHTVPDGDPAAVLDRALTLLVATLEKQKLAATDRPRSARPLARRSRHIPARVKRAVWERDGGRCTFCRPAADAQKRGSWNSTMSCRSLTAVNRRPRTFSFAAARTTAMKRSSVSGRSW
jgi:hypothetical protein